MAVKLLSFFIYVALVASIASADFKTILPCYYITD